MENLAYTLAKLPAGMQNKTTLMLIGLLAASWCFSAFRVARIMGKSGRHSTKWFLINILFSVIPAMIVLWWDHYNSISPSKELHSHRARSERKEKQTQISQDSPTTCPHCGEVTPPELAETGRCIHCKLPLREENIA